MLLKSQTRQDTHKKVTIGPGNAEAIGDSDRASANEETGDPLGWVSEKRGDQKAQPVITNSSP